MKAKTFYSTIVITSVFLFCQANDLLAQMPTSIDPGQNEDPVNVYEQPEYIIPILALFVLLVGLYFWRKRGKK